ncbi:MAG TPA: potassium transporter Kef [Polyangiaceae bacterium]|nr:potassium transporter Kef [Polyangiaceae bacterium]
MNAILLLLGLLALSYVGSLLRGDRAIRGLGLPSGAEYLCLGVVLGSHALGIIDRPLLESFEPLLVVAASWIAFIAGLGYNRVGVRPIAFGRAALGVLGAALAGLAVFAAVYFALPFVAPRLMEDRVLCAGGAGCVCSGTTRQAVRWVVQRYAAVGPLSDALADYARASALVPVVGLGLLLAYFPVPGLAFIGFSARAGLTLGIGALLGLVALALLSRGVTRDETWGILVGTALLSMGVAARLGLSPLAASFALGLTIGMLSRRRAELTSMVRPTERAVLLPLAVLAGALVDVTAAPRVLVLVPLALAARYAMEFVRGLWLCAGSAPARRAGPLVGYALVSTGEVTLACAVSIAVAFERPAALGVLAIAAAGLLLGEVVAPLALRRALVRTGELDLNAEPLWEPRPGDAERSSDPA